MSEAGQYVTDVHPNDVLFGRGSGPNDHEGNIKFRDMVAQRKAEYMATNHRQTKANIAKTIVDAVIASNGRFLKKLEPAEIQKLGYGSGVDLYQVVDDDTIMEKAKQALRQNRDKTSSGPSPSMENDAQQVASSMMMRPKTPPRGGNNLPPHFVQGNQGQFGMPNPMTAGMMNPAPAFSIHEQQVYREDSEGYATYTTTLDDPEDVRIFETARRMGATPPSAAGPRRGSLLGGRKGDANRRESLQMNDVWRRESLLGAAGVSMDVSELMASFKGMSTTGELNSSSDTIGTIEGNMYGNSQISGISNMSVVSMASATSLFKNPNPDNSNGTNEGAVDDGDDTFPGPEAVGSVWNNINGDAGQQDRQNMSPPGGMNPRGSMIPRDAWNSGQLQSLLRAPIDGSSTMLALDTSGAMPRPVHLMEDQLDSLAYLGASSMSVLRGGDQSSTSFRAGNGSSLLGAFDGSNVDSDRIVPSGRK